MADEIDRIYWDANCFTYLINADVDRLSILSAIMDGVLESKGKQQIVTSVISKIEVAFSLQEEVKRRLSDDEEARIAALWEDVSVIAPIEVHDLIVEQARLLIHEARQATDP